MSRNQLNQKFKLMVDAQDMLYILTLFLTREPFGLEVCIQHMFSLYLALYIAL